jgi:dTDP-4-dehydrorhamnose reductase
MRILITGSNGLLGQKLIHLLLHKREHFFGNLEIETIACSRGENRLNDRHGYAYVSLDLTDKEAVDRCLNLYLPDCIIHTAAMTNVDACELEPESCRRHNVDATKNLIQAAKKMDGEKSTKTHFIHLSTDFIFDGEKGPYSEQDEPNPISIYGQSKLDAERLVQASDLHWAIIRTIIVYGITQGMSRSNLVLWVSESIKNGKQINVVNDQFRSPTLAEDLAYGCLLVAAKNAEGVYHLSGPDTHSIFELAGIVCEEFHLSKEGLTPIQSALLNQPARRPPKTGFIIEKARKDLGFNPMDFHSGVRFIQRQIKGEQPEYQPGMGYF